MLKEKTSPYLKKLIKKSPAIARQFLANPRQEKDNFPLDPFEEEKHTPLKGLIHKYPNRVLILLTLQCAAYCRFCFRRRCVSQIQKGKITSQDLEKMKNYLLAHKEVSEVILSGGDPFLVPQTFKKALQIFSSLPQIKTIRIGTRVPVTQPKAVTPSLLQTFSQIPQPLWILIHFNHPDEITPQTIAAIQKLRESKAILLSQTVFLSRVNDSFKTLFKLFTQLVQIGVKPYYLFHCDPVSGNKKFQVPLEKEIKIVTQLRKELSGLAFPLFVIEAPGKIGKIPVPLDFWDFRKESFFDFQGEKAFLPFFS